MGDKVVFRGMTVKYFDFRQTKGGIYTRIYCSSEFTQPIMDAMGWEDPGDSLKKGTLEGEMAATKMSVKPNDKKLAQHAFDLDISGVHSFVLSRVVKKDQVHRVLHFTIETAQPDAETVLAQFIRPMKLAECQLTVHYSVQDTLPGTQPDTGQQPAPSVDCVSCENNIDFADEKKKKHTNGIKCTRKVTQMPLGEEAQQTPQVQ